jgi:hypothetical protein
MFSLFADRDLPLVPKDLIPHCVVKVESSAPVNNPANNPTNNPANNPANNQVNNPVNNQAATQSTPTHGGAGRAATLRRAARASQRHSPYARQ